MASLLGKKGATKWSAIVADAVAVRAVTLGAAAKGSSGKPRVLACASELSGELSVQVLGGLTRKLALANQRLVFTLGRHDYRMLVVPEPLVLPDEVEQSLRWTIANQIDYPVDEANVAWMKIPTLEQQPNRPAHLYAVVARRERIAQLEQLFTAAGLALDAVDVYETAQRNIANLIGIPDEGIGLLRVGQDGVQFTISFNGELYLDRFVEEVLFDASPADEAAEQRAMERIALQVQRSLAFIERNMPFISVARVLIAPLPQPMALEKFIAEHLSLPVEKLNLADCFDCALTPELLQEHNQAVYFTALGAALRFHVN